MHSLTEKYYYFWVMKTKHTFYFLLILGGALLMASGDRLLRKEYSFSLGIILLMFGVYKTSQSWRHTQGKEQEEEEEQQ
jgi:hypothetical protein